MRMSRHAHAELLGRIFPSRCCCGSPICRGSPTAPRSPPSGIMDAVAVELGNAPDVAVRPMAPEDFDSLYEMYREVIADGGGTPAGSGAPSREVFEDGWIRNRAVFVAWSGLDRLGSYFVRANFPAFAGHIAQGGYIVAKKARGRGVGTLLIADSLRVAKDLGFTAMMFNLVFESNPSRRLYEAAGFEVVGRIPEARDGEPGLIYWRRL